MSPYNRQTSPVLGTPRPYTPPGLGTLLSHTLHDLVTLLPNPSSVLGIPRPHALTLTCFTCPRHSESTRARTIQMSQTFHVHKRVYTCTHSSKHGISFLGFKEAQPTLRGLTSGTKRRFSSARHTKSIVGGTPNSPHAQARMASLQKHRSPGASFHPRHCTSCTSAGDIECPSRRCQIFTESVRLLPSVGVENSHSRSICIAHGHPNRSTTLI